MLSHWLNWQKRALGAAIKPQMTVRSKNELILIRIAADRAPASRAIGRFWQTAGLPVGSVREARRTLLSDRPYKPNIRFAHA
jgi:hypothetical protein